MKPEEQARQNIDELLQQAGWVVQDRKQFNAGASKGVAVREYPLLAGIADYLLFVDREVVGIVEAKSVGQTLTGVEERCRGRFVSITFSSYHQYHRRFTNGLGPVHCYRGRLARNGGKGVNHP